MDSEEKLIYLVQNYECLYNIHSKSYSDRNAKNKAWAKVSKEMKLSADECQKKWKGIRDCYRKAILLRQSRSGPGRHNRRIKFEKELEFLKPYVSSRSITSKLNNSKTEENIISIDLQNLNSSSMNLVNPQLTSLCSNNYRNEPQSQDCTEVTETKRNEDPTDSFFLTMSRKIKNMPKKVQAELEREIFRLVNDAEIKLASEQDMLAASPFEMTVYQQQNTPSTYVSHLASYIKEETD